MYCNFQAAQSAFIHIYIINTFYLSPYFTVLALKVLQLHVYTIDFLHFLLNLNFFLKKNELFLKPHGLMGVRRIPTMRTRGVESVFFFFSKIL